MTFLGYFPASYSIVGTTRPPTNGNPQSGEKLEFISNLTGHEALIANGQTDLAFIGRLFPAT